MIFLGIPFSLGSWWETPCSFVLILPALIWRLIEEEKFLSRSLGGLYRGEINTRGARPP